MTPLELESVLNTTQTYQQYEFYYSLYHYVVFLVGMVLIALVLLHVLCRPRIRRNSEFWYLVIHLLCISFAYSIINVLWQPVLLTRTLGGYSVGLLKYFGPRGYLLGSWLSMSVFHQLSLNVTIFFSIHYFHFRSFKQPRFQALFNWFSSQNNMLVFLNCALVCHLIVLGPAFYRLYSFGVQIPVDLQEQFPEIFVVEPLTHGLYLVQWTGFAVFILLFFQVVFCLFVYNQSKEFVRVTNALVSAKTFEMQRQFCRMFLLRLCLMIVFLFIPNFILQLRTFIDLKGIQMGIIGFMALHCPLQALITIKEMPEWKKVAQVVNNVKKSGSN